MTRTEPRIPSGSGFRTGDDASPRADAGVAGAARPPRPAVCVFCGAKPGDGPQWAALAREVGRRIAASGWALVYGGGRVGLMGAMADGALQEGGDVIGVIPRRLVEAEVAHLGCTRLEEVANMATRKTRMIALSDAFVALPGGLGTLDELFEVLTLAQLAYHDKPIVLLDPDGFWQGLLQWGDEAVARGFVHASDWDRLQVVRGPDEMAAKLGAVLRP